MAGDLKLTIKLNADGTAAVTGLERVAAAEKKVVAAGQQAGTELGRLSTTAAALAGKLVGVFSVATLASAVAFSRQVALVSDDLAMMTVRMSRLGGDAGFAKLIQMADDLGVSMQSAAEQVQGLSPGMTKLGKSFDETIAFASKLSTALTALGSNAAQANSFAQQLAQSLGGGAAQWEELQIMQDAAGGLTAELEKTLQKSLQTTDSLKAMAEQGKLTPQILEEAFRTTFERLAGDMAQIPVLLEQQQARLGASWERLLKGMDDQLHLSDLWKSLTGALDTGLSRAAVGLGNLDAPLDDLQHRVEELTLKLLELRDARARALENSPAGLVNTAGMDAQIRSTVEELDRLKAKIKEIQAPTAAPVVSAAVTAGVASMTKGLNAEFASNLTAMISAASAQGITLGISSGLRTTERQAELWAGALKKYGSAAAARKWVAPPGHSQHEKGMAADLKATGDGYRWVAENAERFGLAVPLANERWHVELAGARKAETAAAEAARKAEAESQQRRLDANRAFTEQMVASVAGRTSQVAAIEAEYAAKIAAAQRNPDADPAVIKATVASLEQERQDAIYQVQSAAAQKLLGLQSASASDEVRLRMEAAQTIIGIQNDLSLSVEQRQAGANAVLATLNQRLAELNQTAPLTTEQMQALGAAYGTSQSAMDAYTKETRDLDQAFEAGVFTADEYQRALEQIGLTYAKSQGPLAAYVAGLEESAGTLESVTVDMLDRFRSTLVDGLAAGKLSFDDFVDYAKKRLIELAVNKIFVEIVGVVSGLTGTTGGLTQVVGGGSAGSGGSGGSLTNVVGSLSKLFGGSSMGTTAASWLETGASWLGYSGAAPTAAGLTYSSGLGGAQAGMMGVANWAGAGAGLAGGFIGSAMYPDSPYAGLGGSVGGIAGLYGGAAVGGAMGLTGAAAGAMMGSVVPVIGTIIGAVLGAVAGNALGGGEAKAPIATMATTGGRLEFAGANQSLGKSGAVPEINAAKDQANANLDALASQLGDEAAAARANFSTGAAPKAPEEIGAWITEQTQAMAEAMVQSTTVVLGDMVKQAWADGGSSDLGGFMETVAQLKVLEGQLPDIAAGLQAAGMHLGDNALSATASLVMVAGGVDNLAQLQGTYASLFTTVAEQTATQNAAMTSTFAALGSAVPPTRAALDDLVKSFDLSTDAGRKSYVGVMGMAEAMDAYYSAAEAAEATLQGLLWTPAQQQQAQLEAARAQANALGQAALGIDIGALSIEGLAAAIEGLGGIAAVVGLLGTGAGAWAAAVQTYYAAANDDGNIANAAAAAGFAQRKQAADDALRDLGKSLMEWVERVREAESALAEGPDGYATARAAFLTQYSAARAGDREALEGLTGYADTYLAAAKRESATRLEYARTVARVTAQVEALARTAGGDRPERLPGFAAGGIARGPASGYPVMLHGTEAIIPLNGVAAAPPATDALLTEVQGLRAQLREAHAQRLRLAQTAGRVLEQWDYDGLPAARS
jgi:tape measure domain-containing protein